MIHRHLVGDRHTLAALDDLLENGTLADWRPVLARVRREPDGELARKIELLLDRRDLGDTGAFWRAFLGGARSTGRPDRPAPVSVARTRPVGRAAHRSPSARAGVGPRQRAG